MLDLIKSTLDRVQLCAVMDHSGRGGNAFFLTSFDDHPNVLACPLMHYSYSYVLGEFGDETVIEATKAKDFLTNTSYFRLLYHASHEPNIQLRYRMGAQDISVPESKIKEMTDLYFHQINQITRKDLITLPFIIYALAMGKELSHFEYVLVSDAVSLRTEHVLDGFSGKVIDCMVEDFKTPRLISLVRDPRATFASPRHQFVNSLKNMYALKPGNYLLRLKQLLRRDFKPDTGSVYLYWLLYLAVSAKTIENKKRTYRRLFLTVKNEDMNLHFLKTMNHLCSWLGVGLTPRWEQGDFHPMILGQPWAGTGAYNTRYQPNTSGLLKNDKESVSIKSAGPNEYVTKRWQTKLNQREIKIIEYLFQDEMKQHGYSPLFPVEKSTNKLFFKQALGPFEGETPTFRWLFFGDVSVQDRLQRWFYGLTFAPFYVLSRIQFYTLLNSSGVFKSIKPLKTDVKVQPGTQVPE